MHVSASANIAGEGTMGVKSTASLPSSFPGMQVRVMGGFALDADDRC